jgi:hypothetical protein
MNRILRPIAPHIGRKCRNCGKTQLAHSSLLLRCPLKVGKQREVLQMPKFEPEKP